MVPVPRGLQSNQTDKTIQMPNILNSPEGNYSRVRFSWLFERSGWRHFLPWWASLKTWGFFFKRMWRTNRWLLYTRGPKFRHRQILLWEVHRWSEEPWSKQMQHSLKSSAYVQCRCRKELQAEETVGVTAHSEGWRRLKGTVTPEAREEG